MTTAKHLFVGFFWTVIVMCVVVIALCALAVPAYGIELLAQKYIYSSDPSYGYPRSNEEGAAFIVSYIALIIAVLGAAAYAYDKAGDD